MTDTFDALLDAAVERKTTKPETATVEVLVGDQLVTLKFTELDARAWAHATAANPQRLDVLLDRHYGYNITGACEDAATKSGVRVDGGTEHELKPEQWKKLFDGLSGHDLSTVTDAIWSLNEFGPSQRLAAARKKALTAAQKQKRPSPEN